MRKNHESCIGVLFFDERNFENAKLSLTYKPKSKPFPEQCPIVKTTKVGGRMIMDCKELANDDEV